MQYKAVGIAWQHDSDDDDNYYNEDDDADDDADADLCNNCVNHNEVDNDAINDVVAAAAISDDDVDSDNNDDTCFHEVAIGLGATRRQRTCPMRIWAGGLKTVQPSSIQDQFLNQKSVLH